MSLDLQIPAGYASLIGASDGDEFGCIANGSFRWADLLNPDGRWSSLRDRADLLDWMRANPDATIETCSSAPLTCRSFVEQYIDSGTEAEREARANHDRRAALAILRSRFPHTFTTQEAT